MALYLLHTYILLCTIATFLKAGTCLEAQQSMAKQPIKGCVSNHSCTCGESERKIRINLKALEETWMLDNKEFWKILRFLPSFYLFSGFWVFTFLCYFSSINLTLVFQCFSC